VDLRRPEILRRTAGAVLLRMTKRGAGAVLLRMTKRGAGAVLLRMAKGGAGAVLLRMTTTLCHPDPERSPADGGASEGEGSHGAWSAA
jgi:hypothetical protein